MKLEERIKNLKRENEILDGQYNRKKFLCNVGLIGCAASGVVMMFSAPLVGIPLISAGIGCISSKLTNFDNTKIKKEAIAKRLNGLANLSNNKLDLTNAAQQNRASKLTVLQNKERTTATDTSNKKLASKLATAGLVASTILGIAMPGPLSFVAPVLTAIKIHRDKKYTDSLRESENISAEASNLRYEYSVARNLRKQKLDAKDAARMQQLQKKSGDFKKTRQQETQKMKQTAKKVSKQDEDIVDEYIRNIERNQQMSEAEKKMLKKYISNYTRKK